MMKIKQIYLDSMEQRYEQINRLRRCSRCLLPESFPFIEFDKNGECNYCRSYKKIPLKGATALAELADKAKSSNGKPDCLVLFSGGRDSSYTLHYAVKVLGLHPIAYTYDWGIVTPLGYENHKTMCESLGVECVEIKANLEHKFSNIKINIEAWLKRPRLGLVPLFMAGDKAFFSYANKILRERNLKFALAGENLLETTKFKSALCNIPPQHNEDHPYAIPFMDKFRLMAYYGKEFLLNPGYLNSSLVDSFKGYCSYYFEDHPALNLFNYIPWDEREVETTITGYGWKMDPETNSSWRIGDGTAAFYNLIYLTMGGFTENDTFRSNQIREGQLTREKAMDLLVRENRVRWKSLAWYLELIEVDFDQAMQGILAGPRRY